MEIYIYNNMAHSLSPALTQACFNVMGGFNDVCDAVFWFANTQEMRDDSEIQAFKDFMQRTQQHVFYSVVTAPAPITLDLDGFDKLAYHYTDKKQKECYIYLFSRYGLFPDLYPDVRINNINYSHDEIPSTAVMHFLSKLKPALMGAFREIDRHATLSFDYREIYGMSMSEALENW